MDSLQKFVFIIIFYIIAFIYVKEPRYKFFGYIMLTIVYLSSIFILLYNTNDITTGFKLLLENILSGVKMYNVFLLAAFSIVFFNLYSLIKILNAYWYKSTKVKSYNLKLSKQQKDNLTRFDNSFIVGNIFGFLFLLIQICFGSETNIPFIDNFTKTIKATGIDIKNTQHVMILSAALISFLTSFICVWVEMINATRFSYIKRQ
jgi:hypothetical protein